MTGEEMNARVSELLAERTEVLGYHVPDSRRATMRGWPDWVFLAEFGVILRELKGSNDTLSPEQRRVGRLMIMNGLDWGVWWPRDLRPGGRAERELRTIAGGIGVSRETADMTGVYRTLAAAHAGMLGGE